MRCFDYFTDYLTVKTATRAVS